MEAIEYLLKEVERNLKRKKAKLERAKKNFVFSRCPYEEIDIIFCYEKCPIKVYCKSFLMEMEGELWVDFEDFKRMKEKLPRKIETRSINVIR